MFNNIPTVTKNLLFINVLVFIATLINENFIVQYFALFYPGLPWFRFWQPVTYMFVHGGFGHIFFNMWSLVLFGSILERMLGTAKFLTLYFVSGIGAGALHLAVLGLSGDLFSPCVGASGAIYGLLCAYGMLFPDNRLTLLFPPVTFKARTLVLIFVGIELVAEVLPRLGARWSDGIAHFAHLGGMLFAFLLILFWKKRRILFDKERVI